MIKELETTIVLKDKEQVLEDRIREIVREEICKFKVGLFEQAEDVPHTVTVTKEQIEAAWRRIQGGSYAQGEIYHLCKELGFK